MRSHCFTLALITCLSLVSCDDKEHVADKKAQASKSKASSADLLHTVESGNINTLKELIKEGVDLDIANEQGLTALHIAATNKHADLVRLLVKEGANVNSPSKNITTPLMSAAEKDHREIVSYLLKQGAQADIKNAQNKTALILAIDSDHLDTVSELLPFSRKQLDTALLYSSAQGKYQVIETLANAGASLYVRHEGGMTPLMLAAQNGHTAAVYTLLENGANRYAVNEHGWTAAQIASSSNQTLIAELLKEKPLEDELALYDDEEEIGWPQPSAAFFEGPEALTTPAIASATDPVASQDATLASRNQPSLGIKTADTTINPSVRAKKKIVKLPFIEGKTMAIQSQTLADISKDIKMLDYKERPLPLVVDRTSHKNQAKHAEIRMLYGEQKTLSVQEGAKIPDTRFKINSIKRKFHDSKITDGQPADISIIEIEDTVTGKRRKITTSIPASASDPWAVLHSQSSGETYAVRAGQKFQTSNGQGFTISDVRPSQIVIVQDDSGAPITIPLGR